MIIYVDDDDDDDDDNNNNNNSSPHLLKLQESNENGKRSEKNYTDTLKANALSLE
jgi:hypothetical protein